MRDTHLILLDGLPGSGKSTATNQIVRYFAGRGVAVQAYSETEPDHPLNVGGALHPANGVTGEALFGRYTVAAYVAESLARWRALVAEAVGSGVTVVLDSYPYQNAVRILLQMDADRAGIDAYLRQVEAIAAPLAPVLIYLASADPVAAWAWACRMRGAEWAEANAAIVTACPYAWNRGVAGPAGVGVVLGAYAALLDELVAETAWPHVVLPHTGGDWETRNARIEAYLEG